MSSPFLSDEWVEEASAIRAEYQGRTSPFPNPVRMNLVVTQIPFGDGELAAHLDTSSGLLEVDKGHVENPDVSITVDYETAKAILVDGNSQAGMQAFMTGRINVQGDMGKLMALQSAPADPVTEELAARVRAITD